MSLQTPSLFTWGFLAFLYIFIPIDRNAYRTIIVFKLDLLRSLVFNILFSHFDTNVNALTLRRTSPLLALQRADRELLIIIFRLRALGVTLYIL